MKGRYATFILAPAGGSGVGLCDRTAAVRACKHDWTAAVRARKHIEFFAATRQKSGILTI